VNTEIKFTTLEDQGKTLQEYSRSLTPEERLELLYELNRRVYGDKSVEECLRSKRLTVYTQNKGESFEQMLERKNRDKQNES